MQQSPRPDLSGEQAANAVTETNSSGHRLLNRSLGFLWLNDIYQK